MRIEKREHRTPAYWAQIPAPVRRDKDLRPNAKLLYAEINSLADSCGYCWATNEYLGSLLDIAPRTVSALVSQLAGKRYIAVEVLRDPKTNEVVERRLWIDKPKVEGPPPPAKNGDTPPADFGVTPPAKNGAENDYSSVSNTPHTPQGGRRAGKRAPKEAPDWKPERFAPFWDFYSHNARGENKQGAIRAWDRLKPSDALIAEMARALSIQVKCDEWMRGIGIPYASTWLNNSRWKDVLKPRASDAGGAVEEEEGVRYI